MTTAEFRHPFADVMDARGFLPQHDCRTCGKPLQGEGSGRPAELYAGTYTGECYTCQNAPQKLVREFTDGARCWSYAPHCPSWRRNREEYTGYADCSGCSGSGRLYVSRGFPQGGPYYVQCEACSKRFWRTPARAALQSMSRRAYRCYQLAFEKRLRRKPYKGNDAKVAELRAELLARHKRAMVLVDRLRERLQTRGLL